jgi:hypothetical protein
MKLVLLTLSLLALVSGCGHPESASEQNEIIYPAVYSNSPIALAKQSLSCNTKNFSDNYTSFNLHLFLEGASTTVVHNFSPLLQGLYLRNDQIISRSVYGEGSETIDSGRSMRFRILTPAKDIKLCPEDMSYSPETVESAALNTSYFIYKTNLKFTSLLPEIKVTPIILNITPSIIKSVLTRDNRGGTFKQSSYQTDNAFYMPSTSTVTFLPHSQKLKRQGLNVNYWEVPMVASHEYGHHLFQSIYKNFLTSSSGTYSCFDLNDNSENKVQFKSGKIRSLKNDDILNGYNEGFADLISYYSLDEEERGVEGIGCLQGNRDVGSSRFFNWEKKNYSAEVLQSYLSTFEESSDDCNDIRFQNSHTMGSVFAYSADSFLNLLTTSDDQKLLALVDWINYLRVERNRLNNEKPDIFIKKTLSSFMRLSVKKFNKNFNAEICRKAQDIHSGLNLDECADF